MRAALLYGKEDIRVEEIETPKMTENDVLLKVESAFVCGTDLRIFKNGHNGHGEINKDTRLILGHEISAIIADVGEGARGFEKGMRVAVAPNMGCGVCEQCVGGNTQLCRDYKALGINLDGGFAEYVRVPEAAVRQGNIVEIPPHVSFEEAALTEPLSCVYNGFSRCGIGPGDTVLIIGAGPIGIMHAKLAKMAGAAKIVINDLSDTRLHMAANIDESFIMLGSDALRRDVLQLTGNRGVDVCITACPSPQAQMLSLEVAATNARILFFGGLAPNTMVSINSNLIHYKQLTVTGTTRSSLAQFRKTLDLIANGLVDVKPLVSSRYSVGDIRKALGATAEGKGLKSMVMFGPSTPLPDIVEVVKSRKQKKDVTV